MSPELTPELTPELCNTARVFFLLYCSPPPEALFLFFHSTPLCFWTLSCGVLKSVFLYHFSPSLACSLSLSLYEKQGSLLLTAVLVWGSVCVYMCLSMSTIVLCHAHLSSLCTETEILTVCFTCQRATPKAHMWTQNRTNKDTKSFIL